MISSSTILRNSALAMVIDRMFVATEATEIRDKQETLQELCVLQNYRQP